MSGTARRLLTILGIAVLALAGTVVPAQAAAAPPTIRSVTFSGNGGLFEPSPTVTITGVRFGAAPRGGTAANDCVAGENGKNYGSAVYFNANRKFGAGYSDADGSNCVGLNIVSWSGSVIVLTFGEASYGNFDKYELSNGNGYAISVKGGIYGDKVRGLGAPV